MKFNYHYSMLFLVVMLSACDDIIELEDLSARELTVLAPKEGSTPNTNTVNFNWEEVEDATSYQVQIAQPTFENASQIVLDSVVSLDTLGYVPTNLNHKLLNGAYQWRIRAKNSGFNTAYFTFNFEVNGDENADIIAPNTPVLILPTSGTSQDETAVTFTWSRVDVAGTAERDSIFIYEDENLETIFEKGLGANKSYSATLAAGSTYYWRVRAFDTANESEYSETFTVTIN